MSIEREAHSKQNERYHKHKKGCKNDAVWNCPAAARPLHGADYGYNAAANEYQTLFPSNHYKAPYDCKAQP